MALSRKFVLVALACGLVLFSFVVSFPLFASSSDVPATPIKKAAIIYGFNWNSQSTSYVASNYDLLIVDFNGSRSDFYIPYAYWMSDLKIKSGSIQIYGYKDLQYMASYYDDWAEVNTHEDWFVHDDLGNRITNPRWGTYLMDVGNDGWRQHYLSYVNQKLSDCPSYSGVFADDVGDTLYPESFNRAPNAATVDRWHADTLGMLQYVDANLVPGKSFIINTESGWAPGHVNSDYINVVDGMLIEGYYHAPWEDSSSYSKVIESQLNCLSSWSSKGKIMIAGSGSAAEDSRILKWTYSTFLLGVDGSNTYWSWNIGSSYTFDPEYHAITNTNLGSPIGSYYLSQDVYMRNFTGGLVLANPSRNPHTIDLGISFWLLNNTQVSSFTLGAYSGEVLLNEPVPTPTPTPSPTPSPSPSPTPTFSPTPSPTPTRTPSPTPTRSPTLSPTVKPTNSPTVSPPTSISPTPTLTAPPSKKPTTPSTSKSPTLLPSPSSSSISREGNSSIPTSLLYVGTSVAIVVVVCAVFVRKDFRKALGKRFPFIHR